MNQEYLQFLQFHRFSETPSSFDETLMPGRVYGLEKDLIVARTPGGDLPVELTGRFRILADSPADYPVVGDRITIRYGGPDGIHLLESIHNRTTFLERKEAGSRHPAVQAIAANVDLVLIFQGLDRDFNLRRIDRYMALIRGAGARPVVVLNKSDLVSDPGDFVERVRRATGLSEVFAVSSLDGRGISAVKQYFSPGDLIALLGSSGAGKSSFINSLAGNHIQKTGGLRLQDGRGRHTTTGRRIFELDGGALIMDTPGMRELGLLAGSSDVEEAFPDIAGLSDDCRFRDCTHSGEPGCAVRKAIEEGGLEEARLYSYRKLLRETDYEMSRVDPGKAKERKEKWKKIHSDYRKFKKNKERNQDRHREE